MNTVKSSSKGQIVTTSENVLLRIYESQWRDIIHIRNQEIAILPIVSGMFIAASILANYFPEKKTFFIPTIATIFLASFGCLVLYHHRMLFLGKMRVIRYIEKKLDAPNVENLLKLLEEENEKVNPYDGGILEKLKERRKIWSISTFLFLFLYYLVLIGCSACLICLYFVST